MQSLKEMEFTALLDLLARQTAAYTRMMSSGATQAEFDQCKNLIAGIQEEILSRKETSTLNVPTPPVDLSPAGNEGLKT